MKDPAYATGPRLMDMIDMSVFDYLIGNGDRHSLEFFDEENTQDSIGVMFDNGKG